jgi:hypothetical protein
MLSIGDVVKIKNDIINHFDYVPEMYDYLGREVTVARVCEGEFNIVEDNGMWIWYDEMIDI